MKGIDIDTQKIIFKGKSLNNPDTILDKGIKDGDMMVLMVTVKKQKQEKI